MDISALICAVKAEFGDDSRRITHALAVLERARWMLSVDGGNRPVVTAAALLHDIGIPNAERKYGSAAPEYQEIEGPPVARRILDGLNFKNEDIEHVCLIVGSHHSGGKVGTLEFSIVWDADIIINWLEGKKMPALSDIDARLRSHAGKEMARELFHPDCNANGGFEYAS